MCKTRSNLVRPLQAGGPRPPVPAPSLPAARIVEDLQALDQGQLWSTRRLRVAFLTQAAAPASAG